MLEEFLSILSEFLSDRWQRVRLDGINNNGRKMVRSVHRLMLFRGWPRVVF